MKRSTCVIVGFLTLAATATAHGQDDTTLAAARRFVGCYAVELGAWSKPVVPNPSYDAPPVAVSLDSVLIDGRGGPGFRLAPTIEILTRYVTIPPRWWPIGADSVRLWWPSGIPKCSSICRPTGPKGPSPTTVRAASISMPGMKPAEGLPSASTPWSSRRTPRTRSSSINASPTSSVSGKQSGGSSIA